MSRAVEVERHSRRDFLKWGAVAVAAVAAAGVGGKLYGEGEVRGQLLRPGDLSPELRAKLTTEGIQSREIPPGLTIANMREAGVDISPFPLPEGEEAIEQAVSKRRWAAVNPGDFYLAGEEDATVSDLNRLVSTRSTAVRRIDNGFQAVSGDPVELAWLDHALRLETGEGLINGGEGFIITGAKVGTNGVAIGRREPGAPLEWTTFDTSTQNPTPPTDKLVAAVVVVAR